MIEIELGLEIDRPVEDVFGYLTDPAKLRDWQRRGVEVEQETAGPFGRGTQLRERRVLFGKRLEQLVEVLEHEPPRRLSMRILSGPLPLDGHHELEPVDGRTRLRFRVEGETRGLARLAEPVLQRVLAREFRAQHERLRENLERRAAS